MLSLNYEKLFFTGERWGSRSKELLENNLSVWDKDHKIIICHPNIVFNNNVFYKEDHCFDRVDWDNIDEDFKVDNEDSFISFIPDASSAIKYVVDRFRKEIYLNDDKPKYLAVIEEDPYNNHLARCILRATSISLEIAVNPEYEKYRPKTIYDKETRYNETPINIKEYLKDIDGKRLSFKKNINFSK